MNKKIISFAAAVVIAATSAASVYADPKSAAELLSRRTAYDEHLLSAHTKDDAQTLIQEIAYLLSSDADIAASMLDDGTQKLVSSYFDLSYSAIKNDKLKAEDYDNAYHCLNALKGLIVSNISAKKLSSRESMNIYINSVDSMQIGFIVEHEQYTKASELKSSFLEAVNKDDNAVSLSYLTQLALHTAGYYSERLPVFDANSLEFNNTFTDVAESDWFYNAVSFVCSMSIFKGVSETSFEPQTTMTRAMFITALSRTETMPDTSYDIPYSDVDAGSWYAQPVGWAAANGLLSWIGGNEFLPDQPITREEMVQTIYLCSKKYDVSAAEQKDISAFSDYAVVAADKTEAFSWAYSAGIVNGNSDGTLNPLGTAKRCEVAQIFLNLFNFLQK